MDIWHYYDVTHTLHTFSNPVGEEKVDELGRILGLSAGDRILDIACGHGEMIARFAETHGCGGVGVDISPFAISRARARTDAFEFVQADGAEFSTDERFDVAMCVGASWIWNGFEATLRALVTFAKPGGLVVSGEPFWIVDPSDEYLAAADLRRDQLHTLSGCRDIARDLGLETVWMSGSTLSEWDRYEMLQSAGIDRFAKAEPDHPDLAEMRARRAGDEEAYMRWGRDCCGFATWVFRTPG